MWHALEVLLVGVDYGAERRPLFACAEAEFARRLYRGVFDHVRGAVVKSPGVEVRLVLPWRKHVERLRVEERHGAFGHGRQPRLGAVCCCPRVGRLWGRYQLGILFGFL